MAHQAEKPAADADADAAASGKVGGKTETLRFQSEAKQLLHLVIHSLYSNREIFLRELISNAADAVDRLRFAALQDSTLAGVDTKGAIHVEYDATQHTVTVRDNGIGMSRQEVTENLGTIARSGTAEFFKALTGDARRDTQLIGQFGVGFYSAFIVAQKVEVFTRRAGAQESEGVHWTSAGEENFAVETVQRPEQGTTVLLHLRDDAREFADGASLRGIVKRYSDYIRVPVLMRPEEEPGAGVSKQDYTQVNIAKAIWERPQEELHKAEAEAEVQDFYKQIGHDAEPPLRWSRNHVEGVTEYTSLLFIPSRAPFDLWQRDGVRGLRLYVQRTFIMDAAEQFLPLYLRFVKGVLDSSDLPLNVSRELLQKNPAVERIRTALTRRVLDMLGDMAKKQAEDYAKFWQAFGRVIKEGVAEDSQNREKILPLLRFSTTHTDREQQDQSLADYVGRMSDQQEEIYYVCADGFEAARTSPQLEIFRSRGVEALLLYDPLDEWFIGQAEAFQGKQFKDVARGQLALEKLGGKSAPPEEPEALTSDIAEDLVKRLKEALGDAVAEVRATRRLVDSLSCLALGEYDMSTQMRHMLRAAGRDAPEAKQILEINPQHPLAAVIAAEHDSERFKAWATLALNEAYLSSGEPLQDPGPFIQSLNQLLQHLAPGAPAPAQKAQSPGKKAAPKPASSPKDAAKSASSGAKAAAKSAPSSAKTAAKSSPSGTKAAAKSAPSGTKAAAKSAPFGTKTAAKKAQSTAKTAHSSGKKGADK